MDTTDTYTITKLDRKIDALERQITRNEAVLNRGIQTPGAFQTGRSGRSRALEKRHTREVDRHARLFADVQQAKKDLSHAQRLRDGIAAGELTRTGARKATAPSRLKQQAANDVYAAQVRQIVQPGDSVELSTGNRVIVKRVNQKTVTTVNGVTWKLREIRPVKAGKALTVKEVMRNQGS